MLPRRAPHRQPRWIDILKSLPSGVTTYAPGTGFSVTGQ